jgi:hypothetical protein
MVLVVSLLSSGMALTLPSSVTKCLARHPNVTLNQLQKPSYLRVAFSTSGQTDYIVAVKEHESKLNRALVCRHDDKDVLLGAATEKQPFSDMKGDNYMSSRWRVCTKKQVAAMREYYQGVPEPLNESVCLLWEDAEALIYWDGQCFRWKSLEP